MTDSMDDRELERLAPELHEEWDSPRLWTRIEAELAAEKTVPKAVPIWRWAVAVAALLAITVALYEIQPVGKARSRTDFLTREALRDVEQSEAAHSKSIERLSMLANVSLQQSPTPLAAVYREKLVLLDAAIADLKQNLDGNQYNLYLRNQLASLYQEKQSTLKGWLENAKNN